MTYDVAYRHAQALDPSALTTLSAARYAIERAADDCRRAGIDPDADAAVRLLARHLATLACSGDEDRTALRRSCMEAIAAIRRTPVLPLLADRGVAYDEDAKRLFHAEGRRALKRLADALGLAGGSVAVRSNPAGPAVSGEISLAAEGVWIELSLGLTRGRELLFRRGTAAGCQPGRNHWASVEELLAPDRLAARITAALGLAPPACSAAAPAPRLLVA